MTLLAIFAHPDDETFGCGGTLARAAAEGLRVELICATRGEAGKVTDPALGKVEDVGRLREEELRAACRTLGMEPPRLLDYRDSGRYDRTRGHDSKALLNVAEETLEQVLLAYIAQIEPAIILTFDPHGIYGHIDHIKVHRAATAAFWAAGGVMQPAPRRLFYTAMTSRRMLELQAERPTSPLANLDVARYGVSEDSLAAIVDIAAYAAQKEAAVRAHRSQVGPNSSFAGLSREGAWAEMFLRETFTLGGLRGAFPAMPVDTLWTGLGLGSSEPPCYTA